MIEFDPSEKQWEYIAKANRRWNIKCGAVRSGKSFIDISYMIPKRLMAVKDKDGINVILGVSNGTIERNVLQPMRERYTEALVGVINNFTGKVQVFGQDVYCIGAEKINAVAKIQGVSVKYAYGDEIAKWNKEVFMMLESRLDKPYSCFDGTCNPDSPNHWFKKWLENPKLDLYLQNYVLFDNPHLSKSFVDSLCNEYEGTVYYDRYILGKWALAEGLIYPNYIKATAEPPEEAMTGGFEEYSLSIDYGTQNAFAALLWGKYKGVWYAFKEYYWSGRDKGIQKTDEEYGDDLDAFVIPAIKEYRERYQKKLAVYDPFAVPEKLETIVDPSAASFIALLKKKEWCKVRKARNNVLDGIRDTNVAMYEGLIKISPNLKNWKNEVQGYVWDSHSGEDKPVKVNDHLMDSMRYFVETKRLVRKKRARDDFEYE